MGGGELTDLPIEPAPPDNAPGPGVVVLGRFQPVHRGHSLMIAAANRWRISNLPDSPLIIAIGSSNRAESIRNPWSSKERRSMLEGWLSSEGISAHLVEIPDIDDPPNWVSHSERYHGKPGVLFTSDPESAELYESSGWQVVMADLESRETFEGWRVRATAQMMSTVTDADAVKSVLRASIPDEVVSYLMDNDMIRRLAFLGEGGEPVG
tara:strand:+ start:3413 stop:4039 length:627 start_codon:yes stop_codon:yes gene_type:complete